MDDTLDIETRHGVVIKTSRNCVIEDICQCQLLELVNGGSVLTAEGGHCE